MARKNAHPKTSVKRLEITQRRQQAVQLKIAGIPVEQIAAQLAVDRTTVYKDIQAAMDAALALAGQELRAMQLMRYEELIKALWLEAKKGGLTTIDRLLAVMAAENRLIGTEAPTKFAPTTPDGEQAYDALSPDAVMAMVDQEIADIISKANERAEGRS